MKKIILSDAAFDLLVRIQFLMSLYGSWLSKSEALVFFCKEVNRATPRDSLLQTGFTKDEWDAFLESFKK